MVQQGHARAPWGGQAAAKAGLATALPCCAVPALCFAVLAACCACGQRAVLCRRTVLACQDGSVLVHALEGLSLLHSEAYMTCKVRIESWARNAA